MTARILVVEDEDLVQLVIAGYLEDMGFSVELASTAAEANSRAFLPNGRLDAAIIDMSLPDATGDALVSELRSINPMLPIVISSGYDKTAMQAKIVAAHLIEVLTKPYSKDQLRDALHRIGIDA